MSHCNDRRAQRRLHRLPKKTLTAIDHNMLLIITGSEDVTADLVEDRLHSRSTHHLRLNTDTYPTATELRIEVASFETGGFLRASGVEVSLADIDTVWYRKPQPPLVDSTVAHPQARQFAEEESKAALSGVYSALDSAFWVSPPGRIRAANDKIRQLITARQLGFEIPNTLVTTCPDAAREFIQKCGTGAVVKPLRSGCIEYPDGNVELIYTNPVCVDDDHIGNAIYAPCLFQEYVPKRIELRVTIIGTQLFSVALDSQSSDIARHDWRRQNGAGVKYSLFSLPDDVAERCFRFMEHFALRFSAFDFVLTPDGRYVFLEINPNGQWAWLDLELSNGMIDYMADYLSGDHRR